MVETNERAEKLEMLRAKRLECDILNEKDNMLKQMEIELAHEDLVQ